MNIFSNYYYQDVKSFLKETLSGEKNYYKFNNKHVAGKYRYIFLPNTLSSQEDIQEFIGKIKKNCNSDTRIVTIYFNFLWKPILDLATFLNLRKKDDMEPNWLSPEDIKNLFFLEGFDFIKKGQRYLCPIPLGWLSDSINRYVANLPLINRLCLTTYQIFRIVPLKHQYSVSIIIPARNETENIRNVLKKIPRIGKKIEVIFVEGNSTDDTYQSIQKEIKNNKSTTTAFLFKQTGQGKGDAVRLGFKKAKNEILMILDADLTVPPKDLIKFYRALAEGKTEFANGSRLIYPMENQAMRILNYFGNKFFSISFTYLLGHQIKDTLCGTKVLFKKDYQRIVKNRKQFGDFDPFGDFDLLFGAAKLNLKIIDIPVRYRERVYGKTNISRFRHGFLLIKMIFFAVGKIKFI